MDQLALNNQLNSILSTPADVNSSTSVFGTFTQLTDSKADSNIPQSNLFSNTLTKTYMEELEPMEDPFRELVMSKTNTDPEKLKNLASKAANLQNIEEIRLKPATTVKSIAGIFSGTDTFVKKVEETIKKKYAALEPSDSEGYGGYSTK